jgi:hypothetical protein
LPILERLLAEGHEVDAARRADERPDRIEDAGRRRLDDHHVRVPDAHPERRDARGTEAPLDDRADHLHVVG